MTDEELAEIKVRHDVDASGGPFTGRRSEQARQDRAALIAEVERLRVIETAAQALLNYEDIGAADGWLYWEEKFTALRDATKVKP